MASVTGIALGVNKDKRLELMAITGRGSAAPSGGVWRAHQTAPNGAWSGWESLGLPDNSAVSANAPAVAQDPNELLDVVVISDDGTVWHRRQTAPNGPQWSNWESLGRPGGLTATGTPVLAQNQDGRLEVFVTQREDVENAQTTIWHAFQRAQGDWSAFVSLGRPGSETDGPVAVARAADGRLLLFATEVSPQGTPKAVWHRRQDPTAPGGWAAWSPLGAPTEDVHPGWPVPARSSNGDLVLFTVGSDGAVWFRRKPKDPASDWIVWRTIGRSWMVEIGVGMDVGAEAAGRLLVVATSRENRLWHTQQRGSNLFFSHEDWDSFGRSTYDDPGDLVQPALASNADGRLELFLVGRDGHVYQYTQTGTSELGPNPPVWSDAHVWPTPGEAAPTAPAAREAPM
jgi:hypothetical protein